MRRLLAIAALALTACSPAEAIHLTFGNPDAGGNAELERQASRVAWCESRHDPSAVSPGGGNHGLFQINTVHRRRFTAVTGQPWSKVYDAFWNSVYAHRLHQEQGWGPWTCQP